MGDDEVVALKASTIGGYKLLGGDEDDDRDLDHSSKRPKNESGEGWRKEANQMERE